MISLRLLIKRKSKLLAFFLLSWLSVSLYFFFNATSTLLESVPLFMINDSVIVTSALIFFLMFLDYAQNDALSPKKLALGVALFVAIFTWTWYPTNVITFDAESNPVIPFVDIYYFIQNVYMAILSIAVAYWQLLTASKLPPTMKKVKKFLVIGGIFGIMAAVSVFFSSIMIEFYALMFIGIIGMAIASTIAIQKDGRIVHLLPFKVYRLVVTSKNGNLYYTKEWMPVDVDSVMIAGMLSAINTFAKGALKDANTGVISEIKLQKAVLIAEMKFTPINVLLLASKSSQDLKDSVSDFSKAFVDKYYSKLYNADGFPLEVRPAEIQTLFDQSVDGIVNTFFSNIPSFV